MYLSQTQPNRSCSTTDVNERRIVSGACELSYWLVQNFCSRCVDLEEGFWWHSKLQTQQRFIYVRLSHQMLQWWQFFASLPARIKNMKPCQKVVLKLTILQSDTKKKGNFWKTQQKKYCRGGQAADDDMTHTHRMLDMQGYRHRLEYVIVTAVPQQQWLHRHTSILQCTYRWHKKNCNFWKTQQKLKKSKKKNLLTEIEPLQLAF